MQTRNVPLRLMSTTRSHSSTERRWTGPPPATPAEFTTTSRRPKRSLVVATAAATDSSRRTSPAISNAPGEIRAVSVQRPSPFSAASNPTTRAPSCAKRRAQAEPIPDAAPVTKATFPSNLFIEPP